MKKQAGFTLISVLIALLLLTIGILAVSRTGYQVLRAHTNATTRTTALALARSYLEELRSRDPTTLVNEGPVKLNDAGALSATGLYTRSVIIEQLAPNLRRVTVRVAAPNLKVPVELVTMAFG